LQGAREQFRAVGADLVLIGQAKPSNAADFRRQFGIELPVLADERRESYRAVGARMAGASGLFGPKVVLRGIKTLLGGRVMQGRTIGHPAQLGAALVIGPTGEVWFQQLATDASDNAAPEVLLVAIRHPPSS
jgi:hypothetical protein